MEIWKDVVGYEGLYQVSNLGRVCSLGSSTNHKPPCIRKLRKDKGGYLIVQLHKNKEVKTLKVHRLVAFSFIPNEYDKPHVNHIDGDKTNNVASNLEWCTHKENFKHAVENGLRPMGEDHGRHKLTWNEVNEIRRTYIQGSSVFGGNALSRKFGVTPRVILLIVKGELWKQV